MPNPTAPSAAAAPVCKSPRVSHRTSHAAFYAEPPDPDDPLLGFEPYIHRVPRRNSITPERQRAFIAALAASGIVTQAARSIGASLEALYSLRNRKGAEGFAAAWEAALDRGMARLEDCALERAIQGEERLFLNRAGEVVARWTRYDTALITFLLRQRRSDRFAASQDFRKLKPGHPIYDRLRREWDRERALAEPDIEEVRAQILRKIEAIERQRIRSGERAPDPDNPEQVELARQGAEERQRWQADRRTIGGD